MAFARTGYASTTNPTITIPTHNVGDLIVLGAAYSQGSNVPSAGWTLADANAVGGGVGAAVVYKYAQSTSEESGDWSAFAFRALHVAVYSGAVFEQASASYYYAQEEDPPLPTSSIYPFTPGPSNGFYGLNTGLLTGVYIPSSLPASVYAANLSGNSVFSSGTSSSITLAHGLTPAFSTINLAPVANRTDWTFENAVGDPAFVSELSTFSWYVTAAQAGFRTYYTTG